MPVWVRVAIVICIATVSAIVTGMRFAMLYDLLKYFVIFLVVSNNSAMWSGLLVEMESCKFGSVR